MKNIRKKITNVHNNVFLMLLIIGIGFGVCLLIKSIFSPDILLPAIMVLSVFLVSVFTDGYVYGILASVMSVIIVNFAFTFPFFAIDFLNLENLASAIIMFAIAFATSSLTNKIKHQEMIKKQSELDRMRANLLRAVSHDFRTPLTTIYGASSALLDEKNDFTEAQRVKMLKGIQQDSQWLYRMVENLLSVTRLDGDIRLIMTPIALDELLDSVLHKFAKRYPGQDVDMDIPDVPVIIQMDPILIEQVMLNILENAVQHAEGMKHIMIRVIPTEDVVLFQISDDGAGIPADRLGHLFDGQLVAAAMEKEIVDGRQRSNAGIGLSVCATIIKAHGGEISAHNLPQGGGVFEFVLRMEEVADEQ